METFLHVLRAKGVSQLSQYLQVIIKARKQGYSFSVKDFRGKNVGERFYEWSSRWGSRNSESDQSLSSSRWNKFHFKGPHTSDLEDILDIFKYQGLQLAKVTGPTPKHSSSSLRFLVWVYYIRKKSPNITTDERRTCPLFLCREKFETPEIMLQHVYSCPHLSNGLYWCPECQSPKRVPHARERVSHVKSSLRMARRVLIMHSPGYRHRAQDERNNPPKILAELPGLEIPVEICSYEMAIFILQQC